MVPRYSFFIVLTLNLMRLNELILLVIIFDKTNHEAKKERSCGKEGREEGSGCEADGVGG